MEISGVLEVAAPDGFPKILCELLFAPRDPKPPLLAKLANPEDACWEPREAPLPKTLPVLGLLAAANPDWPNAGFTAAVEPVTQGEGFGPNPPPIDDGWPKAEPAGLPPNDGEPNVGALAAVVLPNVLEPNAGALAAGALPNVLEPNAGWAVLAGAPVDQREAGEDFAPNADGLPNAGALVAGVPNAVGVGLGCCGVAAPSASPKPGYVVPARIESL